MKKKPKVEYWVMYIENGIEKECERASSLKRAKATKTSCERKAKIKHRIVRVTEVVGYGRQSGQPISRKTVK